MAGIKMYEKIRHRKLWISIKIWIFLNFLKLWLVVGGCISVSLLNSREKKHDWIIIEETEHKSSTGKFRVKCNNLGT